MNQWDRESELTAYALGELPSAECARLEQDLSDEDRRQIEETRAAAGMVAQGLSAEPPAGLTPLQHAAIESRLRARRPAPGDGRLGLALSLAASIVIVLGTFMGVLYALFRHRGGVAATGPVPSTVLIVPEQREPRDAKPAAGASLRPQGPQAFVAAAQHPVSAFPLQTDASGYARVRQYLAEDQLPPPDSVRIEQMLNAFHYDDPAPASEAFAGSVQSGPCPWERGHLLARVAIKAREVPGGGPVAEDVRVQVRFNPNRVASYRLLGYDLASAAGPDGATATSGQAAVALYEVVPTPGSGSDEALTVAVEYRELAGGSERRLDFRRRDDAAGATEFAFCAAVAEFALALRHELPPDRGHFDDVLRLAEQGRGRDQGGQRQQFIELVRRAKDLSDT